MPPSWQPSVGAMRFAMAMRHLSRYLARGRGGGAKPVEHDSMTAMAISIYDHRLSIPSGLRPCPPLRLPNPPPCPSRPSCLSCHRPCLPSSPCCSETFSLPLPPSIDDVVSGCRLAMSGCRLLASLRLSVGDVRLSTVAIHLGRGGRGSTRPSACPPRPILLPRPPTRQPSTAIPCPKTCFPMPAGIKKEMCF